MWVQSLAPRSAEGMELNHSQKGVGHLYSCHELCLPEQVPEMSEEQQITVIVCIDQLSMDIWGTSLALGYQPDSLELRFSRDEVCMVYECLRKGLNGLSQGLYHSWSEDWTLCAEPERSERKKRFRLKVEEIRQNIREAQDRELAAGKTSLSFLSAKRECNDKWYLTYWEELENRIKQLDSQGANVSAAPRLSQKGKIKWLKVTCKDMAGKLGNFRQQFTS